MQELIFQLTAGAIIAFIVMCLSIFSYIWMMMARIFIKELKDKKK